MGYDEYLAHDNFFELDPPLSRNGAEPTIVRGESSQICVDAAVEFIRGVLSEGGAPFFVTLWFGSPHSPYRALPGDGKALRGCSRRRACQRLRRDHRHGPGLGPVQECAAGAWRSRGHAPLVQLRQRDHSRGYSRAPAGSAAKRRLAPGHKGALYEGGLRVPGIIEWPAVIRRPRRTSVPAVSTDIFATVLALLGLDHPDPARPPGRTRAHGADP